MNFKIMEDVAISEAAFEAFGKNEAELFENAAIALFELMVDTSAIEPKTKVQIRLSAASLDELLFKWLSELIFVKDAQEIVFGSFKTEIKKEKEFLLNAHCFGEPIKYPDKRLRNDVKAVTKHLFEVKEEKGKFKATVVIDI